MVHVYGNRRPIGRIAIEIVIVFLLVQFFLVSSIFAEDYSYDKKTTVIGSLKKYRVKGNESLIEIARKFGLGYNAIVEANPELDPFVPGTDAPVMIPTSWVLPDLKSYDGIVINISEMRLYSFFKKSGLPVVTTFPIGIGSEGFDTPVGDFTVVETIVKPAWHVPESIRKERPELPKVVPPGPENPLGSHALRLSLGSVLIHGTNKPWGVGRKVSHGCIRLYPEDIPKLFGMTPNRTRVTIIRQPVKIGERDHRVFLEVHEDSDIKGLNCANEVIRLLVKKDLLKRVSTEKLYQALEGRKGMPVDITE